MVRGRSKPVPLSDDPHWFKDAVIYELHVRAFADSNADGIGDFRGLSEKLDYLQDLGVTAIWLLPFCPSPLRDDGYDIADYSGIHSSYGTLQDFKVFLREAHKRGLRVITELVLNHTSDQHPWFQKARNAKPGSAARSFYVWSDTQDRYKETRIIFKDFETSNWAWDPVAKAYYWHRFYSHQPDLNFESPHTRKAVLKVLDFWLEQGVDGLRLDAVPYLFEREGTNCENLTETHGMLKELRQHVDSRFEDRMLLAEANQWPEDAVAYFGDGDECHMAFHFPLMPRLFMASRLEQRYPIVEIFRQTPAIPENCQWAIFLRNHDELTLEMVTDEERDYMYRVYANDPQMRINLGIRRRLAPLLGNNRRKIELMNGLLFSLPGTPVIYYGDELGMGDNIYLGDRNGVRTPMQWSADRNAGFSRANPHKLFLPIIIDAEFHYEALNVETQQNNPSSLLWWMKRLIALRTRYKAFGRGSIEFLEPENRKVLVFLRQYEDETILVVANLSRFTQCAEIDLSAFQGRVAVELFGHTRFPRIGELPYFLTLGPHTFYWFALEEAPLDSMQVQPERKERPVLQATGSWMDLVRPTRGSETALEKLLPDYVKNHRWFGGKARSIRAIRIADGIPITKKSIVALLRVEYADEEPDLYVLPLAFEVAEAAPVGEDQILAKVRFQEEGREHEGVLFDASASAEFQRSLLQAVAGKRRFRGEAGEITASSTRVFRATTRDGEADLTPTILRAEQSNTSVNFGNQFILKLFRRIEPGTNPDLEISRFLTEKTSFANTPALAGFLEYQRGSEPKMTLGILQAFVPNESDAWRGTLDSLERYFERLETRSEEELAQTELVGLHDPLALLDRDSTDQTLELIGTYWQSARLLGQRTAELHVALASQKTIPEFAPEPFTTLYQRSRYQSMRGLATGSLQLLKRALPRLDEGIRKEAESILARQDEIEKRLRALTETRLEAMRIRCHGDYHLGQVLFTGQDFVIIDFEGEPAMSLSERKLKRSPLRDVAGMLRSLHYASCTALLSASAPGDTPFADGRLPLEPWADYWYSWASTAFLQAYLETAQKGDFLPPTREQLSLLLNVHMLEKALYELGYELNNRPHWVHIPLRGIAQILASEAPALR